MANKQFVLSNGETKKLEKGEYHIWKDDCKEKFFYISNNDACNLNGYFYLDSLKDVVIDGCDSKLVFHGKITPFLLDNCENITIKNFVIDYSDRSYISPLIKKVNSDSVVLDTTNSIGKYKVEDNTLVVYGDDFEDRFDETVNLSQEFVGDKPAYNGLTLISQIANKEAPKLSSFCDVNKFKIQKLNNGFELFLDGIGRYLTEGRTLVMTASPRKSAILFSNKSKNIFVENITVYSSLAMGFFFQLSENIKLNNVTISPEKSSGDIVSSLADASHFVNCSGKIEITNCTFENMMDDGVNVHGIFTKVESCETINEKEKKLTVKLKHVQHKGFIPYEIGDKVIVYKGSTNTIKGSAIVKDVKLLDDKFTIELIVESDVCYNLNDTVDNCDRMPEVYINNLKTGNNRPRGVLVTSPKKVVIENSEFYSGAMGIWINGDTTYWFESSRVKDITIKNNIFRDCCYLYGDYPIEIYPEYDKNSGEKYHSGIKIENNIFYTFTGGVVKIKDSQDIKINGNKIINTKTYLKREELEPFNLISCKNYFVQGYNIELEFLPNEIWMGGVIHSLGAQKITDKSIYEVDLRNVCFSNQISPLFISTKGRVIWSDKAFKISFINGKIFIEGSSHINVEVGGKNLEEAYLLYSKKHCKKESNLPKKITAIPQYNTWIPFMYNQNENDILEYAKRIIDNGFTPGILMIDCGWQKGYGDWDFDRLKFPHPKEMVEKLHQMGFSIMLWVVPFVTADSMIYREIRDKGYLVKNSLGKPRMAEWWDGYSAVIDFTNPNACKWFKSRIDYLIEEYKIDGIKLDGGDQTSYDSSDIVYGDATPSEQQKAFSKFATTIELCELRACFDMTSYTIMQRLCDKHHSWDNINGLKSLIPNMIQEGLAGYFLCCPDMVGGGNYMEFLNNENNFDEELFIRWTECVIFMPLVQFGYEVWDKLSSKGKDICRQYIYLREKHIKYIESNFDVALKTGIPVLRGVFKNDDEIFLSDEYLIGTGLLVAPILEKGQNKRIVYLPEGEWEYNGKIYIGNREYEINANIEELPYFIKKNN